jgi:diaminohydroxyphosphoribosylaminopyrimidine deaminase / 5-amino-6-(5-phosphoribosylamino)uracil reductase
VRDWRPVPAADPDADERFMQEALALGRANLGRTWPNPSVGAVIVKDGVVLGRGATAPGGRPHAEAVALEEAGLKAVGADMYVTLEPCSHRSVRGGTPCLELTLLSGLKRVVSALEDPNPHIAGVGHAIIRSAGLRVEVGIGGDEARRDHLGHIRRVREYRPMVTLKLAQTSDGYCAPAGGGRLRISGEAAMREVHLLRVSHEAIMVGVGTVLSDDPQLTVRLPGLEDRQPIRVVLDSTLRTPVGSALVGGIAQAPLWIIAAEDAPAAPEHALRAAGAEVMRVGRGPDGQLDLSAALRLLATRGITRIFSEGGPIVGEALAERGFADVVIISTADHALGAPGVLAVRPRLSTTLVDEEQYLLRDTARHGSDVFATYDRRT